MLGDVPPATRNVTLQYTPLGSSPAHPDYYMARLENVATTWNLSACQQGRIRRHALQPISHDKVVVLVSSNSIIGS